MPRRKAPPEMAVLFDQIVGLMQGKTVEVVMPALGYAMTVCLNNLDMEHHRRETFESWVRMVCKLLDKDEADAAQAREVQKRHLH